MELKIGDRVKVISLPNSFRAENPKIKMGLMGTVKDLDGAFVGVEFDEYMGGHNGSWNGKQGYCWYIEDENLEKFEETDTEEKSETIEQKVFEVLRKEIGVEPDEEFDVYQNGVKQWTCKFKGGEFCQKVNYELCKSDVWIDLIWNFSSYTFKRKSFVPEYEENYFFLSKNYDENKNIKFSVLHNIWVDNIIDYGMLALGNVFRSEEEAFKNKDKLLEKMKKLRKGE